jgi:hypothetical protein
MTDIEFELAYKQLSYRIKHKLEAMLPQCNQCNLKDSIDLIEKVIISNQYFIGLLDQLHEKCVKIEHSIRLLMIKDHIKGHIKNLNEFLIEFQIMFKQEQEMQKKQEAIEKHNRFVSLMNMQTIKKQRVN